MPKHSQTADKDLDGLREQDIFGRPNEGLLEIEGGRLAIGGQPSRTTLTVEQSSMGGGDC